ncbi:LOW QUALITY PROTEIN: hypothetical protein V1477_004487 [Vespula maculifrons]|uniref:Uncharacterized protein n=1 Tax=Vespula maculifrons TaxID=7453 RepID=A0ABD2CLZ3_VESMC
MENKIFSLTIFFSETVARRKTGPGSLERALRALHAHIFFIKIGPIGADYNGLNGTKEKKLISLTIFFSETIAPRKTGPGSLERSLRVLHAHIFFIKIGPIGADTSENRTGVIGKGSSRPTRPYFFYPDRTNRSRVITGTKEKKLFSLTIFFSETIAPRKTGPGSLERALRALHAHIFFIKIGPIGADTSENRTGVIGKGSSRPTRPYFFYPDRTNRSRVITGTKEKKLFSLTIFFSETIAPRKTGPGSLERALRALHAHIFFIKIGPIGADTSENRTGVIGKGSSRPTRPYFFYPDRTNRSRVITEPSYNGLKGTKENKIFSLTIFFSETIAPRKTGPGSLERALRALHAHIFFIKIGPIGAESRVITEPSYNGLKGTKEKKLFSLTIFFSETIAPRKTGPGSLERALRALHAHIFFIKIGPIGADYNGLKGSKEKKLFSLTIVFSETIAPRKTGPGSLERALRALHAHIFFIKIGPIGAESRVITEPSYNGLKGTKEKKLFSLTIFFSETIAPRKTGPGSLERALRALHAHIFFIKIGPIGAESRVITEPSYNGLKGTKENKILSLTIFFSETIAPRKTEPSYNGLKGTKEKKLFSLTIFFSETIAPRKTGPGSFERALRALHAHIFFIKIGPIGAESRVITEPSYNGLKGTKENKIFSLTIFFSETIAPRKTVPGSLERSLRALHAHIFFIKIGPIGAESRVITEPSYNGLKGSKEKKLFSLTIVFSETIAPRKTGPGSLERALRALHAHIFFIKIGPIGAESRVITEPSYNGLKGSKEKKLFSLTIFFSEPIAPRKTGPGSLERALRALHAHIFFIKIGPIGADTKKNRTGVVGKGSSRPTRPYFFYQDRTNRSRVITEPSYNGLKGTKEKKLFSLTIFFSETIAPRKTGPGSLERALRALHAHIFFIKIGPIGAESRVITHLEKPDRGHWKGLFAPYTPIFFYQDPTNRSRVITEPSYNGLKGTKEKKLFSLTIFFSETIAPRKTGPGSLERALRALHAHIFFIKIGPIGAEKTGPGSLERALRALHAHIFFIKIGPIGADYNGLKGTKEKKLFSLTIFFSETIAPRKTGPGSLERALRALHAHIFFIKIGPIGAESRVITEPSYNGLKGTKEKKLFSLTIFFSETIAPRKTVPGSLERALRALHAHIFFIKIGPIGAESRVITEPSYNGLKGTKEKKLFSLTIFFSETIAPRKTGPGSLESYNGLKGTKEKKLFSLTIFFSETIAPRKTGPGSLERSLRALHAHIFFIKIGPIGADTKKNRTWVIGKGSSRPTRPYFFYQDRTNRSRVITEPSYNGLKGTKEKKLFSLTIFFSETIAPRKTGPGSLERALRALHAHIFFIKIGPIGADYNGLKGTKEKKLFSLTIFFSETIAPRKTGPGSLERALRALHAHIFFIKIGPIGAESRVITEPSYNGLKGTKENKIFSLTIFFSETIAPRKTGPGSLERSLRALHAHIFFIKIGPIGAESRVITEPSYNGLKGSKEKKLFSLTIFFSETIAPRKTGPGSLERALRALHAHIFFIKIGPIGAESRVITEPSYNGLKGTKEKKLFSLTIFFSETIAPRKTGPGSLERALRALHAHIFFIKIGPIGAESRVITEPSYNGLKGTKEKKLFSLTIFFSETIAPRKTGPGSLESYNGLKGTKEKKLFSLTIFFSETIAPRKTGPGSLERALRALHAHIFFIKIGPIGAESRVITEPSYNGLKGTKENKIFSLTIFFSETIAPRKTGPGSLERSLRALHAHIFFIKIGPIGAESRVITEPSYNGLKGSKEKKLFSLTIFFSETIAPRKTGPGSLERALRALHAHIFFIKIGPIGAESRVITEPSYNGLKGTKEKKLFSLTIFFSETIAPRKTGPGSLERALRALHAHIFFIKIGPIGAEKTGPGSLERALRALHAHIFFIKIGPIGADYNGLKGTKEKKLFSLTIFFSETIAPRKTGPGSLERALRALHAHIFFIKIGPIGAESRVITHLEKPDRGHWKGLFAPYTPIFFLSRSDQQEPSYNGLKGTKEKKLFSLTIFFSETIAPRKTGPGYNGLKGSKEKKLFSLTIFFSETIAPRKTGPGSLERALRALHAHIFFIKIGPIGAESRVITEPSYNGLKGSKEKKLFSLTIFFSETIAPRKTGPGSLERALRALHAHIFFIKIGPIGAESRVITEPSYNGLKGTKEKKLFSLTIFFSETIAPRKTGPGSLERALRALHAHIFFIKIGPIGAEKTGPGSLERALRALHAHIFFIKIGPIGADYNGLKGTKEKKLFSLTIFFSETIAPRKTGPGSLERTLRALHAHIFFIKIGPIGAESRVITEPSYNGLKGSKEKKLFSLTIFFSETIAPRKTGPGSLERALRALHAHIFFIKIGPIGADYNGLKGTKEKKLFSLTIFFSETIAPRKTGPGSLERALRALHAHIFFIKIGPIGAESRVITEPSYNGLKGTKEKKLFSLTIFFSETIAPRKTGPGSLESYNGLKGTKEKKLFSLTIFFSETIAPRKTGPGSLERALRALHAHIFFIKIGPIGAESRVITEPSYNGLKGTKENKIFSLTIFFSETIAPRKTGPGSLERSLRALHAHIFFIKIGPIGADYNGLKGTKEKKLFSLTIFFSETIAPRKTGPGSLERTLRALHAHIFFIKIGPIGADYNGLKGTKEKKLFSLTIFFSETIAPRKTGPGSLERTLRALHAHIFFIKIGPIGAESRVITEPSYNGLKGTKEKKLFSLTIFFSETIAPRKTGPGSLERALRALHAHIFFIKIGPIGAESRVITEPSYNGLKGTKENKIFSLTIFFSETIAPRKTGPGSLERSLRALHAHIFFIKIGPIGAESRVITEPSYNGLKGSKEKKLFSLTIFFSETIAPRKTGPGSLERALRALHAHIFFIKIGPIGADYNGLKGSKEKKLFSLTIFFSETIAPRKTGPGSLERALRALHAHIFFIKIGPIGAESRVITEPSYNGLKGSKEKKLFSLTIFFSETIAPRKTGPGSLERALRALHAHIFFIKIGPIGADTYENRTGVIGKGSSGPTRPYFFYQDRTNRSRVITEPSYNGLKGTKENKIFSLTIFFSETIAPRKTGPGSLERALRALHAHIFFIKIGPIGAESRVITEPSYNGLKGTKEKKLFSLTIFFSETIAPRKTGPGSLERALRALHAHIFFIKIGPIGADYNGLKGTKENTIFPLTIFFSETIAPRKTGPGSLERALRALHAHIFFIKIGPIGADYNGLKGTKENKIFSLTIFFSETIAPRKTGPGSLERALRALHAHIFFIKIGPIGAEKTGPGSLERALRALHAHIFFIKIGPIGAESRVITEPSYNGLKGTKEKKLFSLTIFFSETIAPRKTGPGSLERALRALHAHIFFIKIGPIGADYNGLKGTKEKKLFSLTLFFSETIAPRKTGPGSLERALRALHAHIFFIKIGPIGADYNGLKGTKEKKLFSLTIFFSETIAPRKTGPGSLERALRALHAHIFFIKIGPIGAESRVITEPSYNGLKGTKEKKLFSLTIFFSETIAPRKTGPGSLERALRALHAYIFFIKIGPIGADYNGLKGTKEKKLFSLTIFFSETIAPRKTGPGSLERALRALHAHIFFIKIGPIGAESRVITEPSYNGLKGTKENKIFSLTIFFSETIAPRKTGPGSLERALRALHAHIFFIKIGPIGAESRVITEPSYNGLKGTKENKIFSLTIFFSETIAPRKTGPGSLERALRALHAHIFFIKIGPIGAEKTGPGSLERALRALHAHIFFIKIGPIGAEKTGPGSLERALRALHAHIFFIKIGPIGADYNGLKGTKEKKLFSLTIFFSETIAPRKTGPGSLERALRALHAHIFFIKIGPIGAEKTGPGSLERALRALHAHIFFIKIGPIGADYNGLKGTKEKKLFSLTIFFSETIAPRKTGPGSLERALRALHAYIFFIKIGPIGADYNGLKGTKEKKLFSLTIFFSETIAPRKTGPGSLERALRALHAHIFFIKIGPIGAESRVITEPSYNGLKGTKENKIFSLTIFFSETIAPRKTGPGSLERALRALHAHIFFIKIGPIGAESRVITEPSYNGLKGTKEKKLFSLTIFFSETIAPRKTGPASLERALRALHAHIFFIKIGPIGAETGVIGKGSSRPTRPYFFYQDRTNRSRVITEPSYNGLKGTKENKIFSLTIFFSETIAPRKTGPGSLERALRALHAHIFFIKIGPIGAESRVITEPSYNGLKGTKEKKLFSLTIFFSETIAPRKTGPGSLERALRALHAHIFFIKIGPIGAESRVITEPSYNGLKGTKEKKLFSLTIFFSETIAPRKTGPGSLERALRALHAHIFFIKIGPIGAESRVITEPSYNGLKGTKEKKLFSLTIFFSETIAPRKTGPGSLERAFRALHAHIFFIKIGPIGAESDQQEPSYNGLKGTKENKIFSLTIFFSETIAPRKTGPGSLERALRALHAHIFFIKIGPIGAESRVITEPSYNGLTGTKENKIFSLTIFFSETIAPRKTGPGSLERALRALHAHIFFIKIGPIGAEL